MQHGRVGTPVSRGCVLLVPIVIIRETQIKNGVQNLGRISKQNAGFFSIFTSKSLFSSSAGSTIF